MQKITGTLIWYYYMCPRETWLMAHELSPNQEDPFLEIGFYRKIPIEGRKKK